MREHQNIPNEYNTKVISVHPDLSATDLRDQARNYKAVIILSFASGVTPQRLNTAIADIVSSGTPIFLLSTNRKDDHGILHQDLYRNQALAADAGALSLETVNVKKLSFVLDTIQEAIEQGKGGKELGAHIKSLFSYASDSDKPKCEWEDTTGEYETNIYESFSTKKI